MLRFRQPLNAYFVLEACLEVISTLELSLVSYFRLSLHTILSRPGFLLSLSLLSQVFVRQLKISIGIELIWLWNNCRLTS